MSQTYRIADALLRRTSLRYILRLPSKPYPADTSQTPSLTFSTFLLSTLPISAQTIHLRQLLSLSSPYIVLVDHSTPSGWEAISHARTFFLAQSTVDNPLHALAPCPHDSPCPLLGTRDICGYRQRLQTPDFLRKTKHKKKGEEDRGYCYLVIAKGERPTATGCSEVGRAGGVAKDHVQRELNKREGKSVLREVEGGEGVKFEMVSLSNVDEAMPDRAQTTSIPTVGIASEADTSQQNARIQNEEMLETLRQEAWTWPRLVAPPMKRSGHVTMDACCPSGTLVVHGVTLASC